MKPIKLGVILLLLAGIAAGIWLSGAVHAKSEHPAIGTVAAGALHVRSEASFSGRITGYLKQGQKVKMGIRSRIKRTARRWRLICACARFRTCSRMF
ncbi:hypothetical protein QS257_17080 [Terrilactibacillus sp. S3-3]|nr:hypothetical protein QS257_17080 [Terrilactibacillus sp. S3-3]